MTDDLAIGVGDRYPTHYETIPHDNCRDPKRCDCECDGCVMAKRWIEANYGGR